MADVDSRYTLGVVMNISDNGNAVPLRQDVILTQYDLTYEDMQQLQETIAAAVLQALAGIGRTIAEEVKGKRAAAPGQNK